MKFAAPYKNRLHFIVLVTVLLLVAACDRGPQNIRMGQQECDHCRMMISQEQFAAQLITQQGRQYVFDAIECMAAFVDSDDARELDIHSLWVPDFMNPGTWMAAESAWYLQSDSLRSPMALNFSAYGSEDVAKSQQAGFGGQVVRWNEVRDIVSKSWYGEPHSHSHSHINRSNNIQTLFVGKRGDFSRLADALTAAVDGDTIRIEAGTYREYELLVDRQVTILGIGRPVIDAGHKGEGIRITADNVHVEGLEIRNVPTSHSRDHAAIRFDRVSGGKVIDNILNDTFFGIYLARAHDMEVRNNRLLAYQTRESVSANGIHLWNSNRAVIADNEIIGHRDGIYLEYVKESSITGNHVGRNIRYGLHFMFSDDCVYRGNRFENNGAGVAVMYSSRVMMENNLFLNNWGASSYGMLLKEITDSDIIENKFTGNTIGIRSEGSDRVKKSRNSFIRNGWAIRIMASSMDNHITENNFIDNAFDVSTNSRSHNRNNFEGNYWDKYSGYDLNGDGIGDVPYRPVRLFSLIVERNPMALMLLRSMFLQILDLTERVMPTITPETLIDEKPLMQKVAL